MSIKALIRKVTGMWLAQPFLSRKEHYMSLEWLSSTLKLNVKQHAVGLDIKCLPAPCDAGHVINKITQRSLYLC